MAGDRRHRRGRGGARGRHAGGGQDLGRPRVGGRCTDVEASGHALQVREHGRGARVAVLAVLRQGLEHDAVEGVRDVGQDRRGRGRDLLDVLVGDGDGRVALEGRAARQQLEENDAGRIQVGASVNGLAASLLGGEVLGGAHDGVRLRHRGLRVRQGARDAKVHDLDLAVRRQHDVARLDVAVHQVVRVRVLEGGQDARHDLDGLVDRNGRTVGDQVLDRVPLDVLHDDVRHRDRTAGRILDDLLARVVDGDDVRVIQRRCRLRFATEARLEDRVLRQIAAQHLDCYDARQASVEAQVDFGHSASPNERADLVSAS